MPFINYCNKNFENIINNIKNDIINNIKNDIKSNNEKYKSILTIFNEYEKQQNDAMILFEKHKNKCLKNIELLKKQIITNNELTLKYINKLDAISLTTIIKDDNNDEDNKNYKKDDSCIVNCFTFPTYTKLKKSDKSLLNSAFTNKVFLNITNLNLYKIQCRNNVKKQLNIINQYNKTELKCLAKIVKNNNNIYDLKQNIEATIINIRKMQNQTNNLNSLYINIKDNADIVDNIYKLKKLNQEYIDNNILINNMKKKIKYDKYEIIKGVPIILKRKHNTQNNNKILKFKIMINNDRNFEIFKNHIIHKIENDKLKQYDMYKELITALEMNNKILNDKIINNENDINNNVEIKNLLKYYKNNIFKLENKILKLYNKLLIKV